MGLRVGMGSAQATHANPLSFTSVNVILARSCRAGNHWKRLGRYTTPLRVFACAFTSGRAIVSTNEHCGGCASVLAIGQAFEALRETE
jgi:hypothetical protein